MRPNFVNITNDRPTCCGFYDKKMPGLSSRHYHQNKCAINHYFKNDSVILIWHFYIKAITNSERCIVIIKFYLPLKSMMQAERGA